MTSHLDKASLRSAALARRAGLGPEVRGTLARRLAADGLTLTRIRGPAVVSVFLPIRDEPDTGPLIDALSSAGFATALPATPPRGEPLRFLGWRPGDTLAAGRFGTREPAPGALELHPDLLFVPLAAFDARCHRLGYGAGYYDGALRRLRAMKPILAVGVAFSAQAVDAVPVEPHDEPLDGILTERGLRIVGA